MTRWITALAAALMTLTACPHRFDPAAAPTVTSPDESATREYNQARVAFDAGKLEQADLAFAAFVQAHPDDPLAPAARLYRGRIARRLGRLKQARDLLQPLTRLADTDPVGHRARYHLGMTLVRLGAHREARALLTPFADDIAENEKPALLAALALCARELNDNAAALRYLDQLHRTTSRETERLWARTSMEALLQGVASRQQMRAIYNGAAAGSLLAALSGRRLAALESAAGDAAEARRILAATEDARRVHDVSTGDEAARSSVVGLLLPLGGRYRAAGDELLRGAVEASGALQGGKGRLALVIRDSSADAVEAARQLINSEQVLALVGTLDASAGAAVARVAAGAGVPFIALSRFAGGSAVQLLPDNRHRARALARHAAASGTRRLLLLAPENRYGKAMAAAFESGLTGGARVVGRRFYRPGTTSFAKIAEGLGRERFDGLFVPDTAHTLSLIAPALARAGMWSGKAPSTDPKGRDFLLLATADGLAHRLVNVAGRYVQGAVLAPGFYPDGNAAGSGPLVRRYQQNQGRDPSLVAALGFDAVELVRVLRERGARTRTGLRTALTAGPPVQGMTGQPSFDNRGQRTDPALLYRVDGTTIRLVAPDGRRASR